ncbi:MAG: hypothetical protein ACPGO3_00150 [Magnetospiraceae bacterium]
MASGRVGFVVLEGPHFAIDWGVMDLRGKSEQAVIDMIADKIAWFLPDVLILENPKDKSCRKGDTSKALIKRVEKQASLRSIEVRFVARAVANRFFYIDGKVNKDKIASVILQQLPELGRAPTKRHPWDPERFRMAMFEAAGYALAYYKSQEM